MGTPVFAVSILKKLHKSLHEIIGVVTVMDKPSGRGQKLNQSAVKEYAVKENIPLLQPQNLKDPEFIHELKKWQADMFVVVAFRMLPEVIWNLPPKGTINLHASLLPNYRGAAPINWALMNGEKESGVTTFFINEKIDEGDILLQKKVSITDNMNAGELHDKLMQIGAELTLKTVDLIELNKIVPTRQNTFVKDEQKMAPKIFKKDCEINWSLDAEQVHNFIRGLSPYPTAWCSLRNIRLNKTVKFKVYNSVLDKQDYKKLETLENGIAFPCRKGSVVVSELQPEGKRKMNFKEFLAGNDLADFQF